MEKKDLLKRMHRLKIFEKDIKEVFVLASGPGGQNVNKVATCVCLEHLPSGITVKFQKHRTQAMNRMSARVLLVDKIDKMQGAQAAQIISAKELKKRQTRKRSTKLKEKISKDKQAQSLKKELRRKIKVEKSDEID